MSDRRVLQIIETELAKAVTFIDLEDERIMSEELPDFYITPESKPSEPLLQPIFFSYLSKRLCYAILSP